MDNFFLKSSVKSLEICKKVVEIYKNYIIVYCE